MMNIPSIKNKLKNNILFFNKNVKEKKEKNYKKLKIKRKRKIVINKSSLK
jgi:hypothetical protein